MEDKVELSKIVSKKKELFGILKVEGNIDSLLKERINWADLKVECKEGKEDILTINSIKIILKHNILRPITFNFKTIQMVLIVAILEEYNNDHLKIDEDTLKNLKNMI